MKIPTVDNNLLWDTIFSSEHSGTRYLHLGCPVIEKLVEEKRISIIYLSTTVDDKAHKRGV
jgi:hypothetical protein